MKTILCESCLREGKEVEAKVFIEIPGKFDENNNRRDFLVPVCTVNGLPCEVPIKKGRARWVKQIVREVQKS